MGLKQDALPGETASVQLPCTVPEQAIRVVFPFFIFQKLLGLNTVICRLGLQNAGLHISTVGWHPASPNDAPVHRSLRRVPETNSQWSGEKHLPLTDTFQCLSPN